jgi:hypothetical protein
MHTLKLVVLTGAVVVPELALVPEAAALVPEAAALVPEAAALVPEAAALVPEAAALVPEEPLELLPHAPMRAMPATAAATCTVLTLNREFFLIAIPFDRCRVTVR